jgi:hypothetical protein
VLVSPRGSVREHERARGGLSVRGDLLRLLGGAIEAPGAAALGCPRVLPVHDGDAPPGR